MFKKIIRRVLGSAHTGPQMQRVEIGVETHKINRDAVDLRAMMVVETLQDAGFEAYIVGGAVRDLLLGLQPKDFDIATDATPEEVKGLFRRAFIVGRRFRIVHVVFGRGRQDHGLSEVFEVSTFRANVDAAQASTIEGNERGQTARLRTLKHAVDRSGRVLRDNVWGDIASDAARRDFTVNAMYYDPSSEVVVDYHGGMNDAKNRILRMIGDPATRYREDPVRILRAIRFAAKLAPLGFELERKTRAPMAQLKSLLSDVPPSRMFDEMLKLVQTGHGVSSIETLERLNLSTGIYPLLDLIVARSADPMVQTLLRDTDQRVQAGESVSSSYFLAGVLWQDVAAGWLARREGQRPFEKTPIFPALAQSVEAVFNERIGDVSGRGKLGAEMREIWTLQPRFEKRVGNSPNSLIDNPRFAAGLNFLKLRASTSEANAQDLAQLAAWWEDFELADAAQRRALIEQAKTQPPKGARTAAGKRAQPRRRAKPARAADNADSVNNDNNAGSATGSTMAGERPAPPPAPEAAAPRQPSGN